MKAVKAFVYVVAVLVVIGAVLFVPGFSFIPMDDEADLSKGDD